MAEQCSQDKFPDPTEAAGGGQLMDGRRRNSQLPSNLCPENKLLLSLVSALALQAPPSLQSPRCTPALLCQPGNAASGSGEGEGRGEMRGKFCPVPSSPCLPLASLHEHSREECAACKESHVGGRRQVLGPQCSYL